MNWKVILQSLKNSEMRNRIFAVLGMLLVFRVLAHIPIPLSDPETLKQVLQNLFNSSNTPQLFSFIDIISGGALANFAIVLVGLGPYINASIIMQLLTKAIPTLETMNKEGEFGRRKINQYTRLLTFPLAIIQSIGAIYIIRQTAQQIGGIGDITANATIWDWTLMVAALTGGAMVLMWLGELITEKGIGNGISLLITVGIVSTLPGLVAQLFGGVYNESAKWNVFGHELPIEQSQFWFALGMTVATLLVTVIVVRLNEARRRITISYAKRVSGNRTYGGVTTVLPVKLITAGVIPIIFAVAFLSVPSFVGQLLVTNSDPKWSTIGQNLVTWFQTPSPQTFAVGGWEPFLYPALYFVLVFMFTFFYTGITFNNREIAENLQKQGGFIGDIRAGTETERYLGKVVNRLTLFGALALGLLAILPIVGQMFINSSIAIGGTSILILVAVSLETLRAIESRALMVTYDQYEQPDFLTEFETDEANAKKGKLSRLTSKLPKRSKKN